MPFKYNKKHLVIVGNGLASQRLVSELVKRRHNWRISIISSEPVPGYNRIMLSSLLAGNASRESITSCDADWYKEHSIDLKLSCTVTTVDAKKCQVHTAQGEMIDFDKLVIATGSKAMIPDLPGSRMDGVTGFRDMADVDKMLDYCNDKAKPARAIVVGAGLLGIEAAVGLASQGIKVTLLHRKPVLMNRQIDASASGLIRADLEKRGIDVMTGVEVKTINGNDNKVKSVSVTSGEWLKAGLVVFATGIVPVKLPVINSGEQKVVINRGIVVDNTMKTGVDSIYALGECIEFEGNTYGLVAPIWQQASVLADVLTGRQATYYEPDYVTKLKVSGMDVHSMGDINSEGESLTLDASGQGIYRRIVLKDNRLKAALLVGDVQDSQWYFELMQQQCDISALRSTLTFGKAFDQGDKSQYLEKSRITSAA